MANNGTVHRAMTASGPEQLWRLRADLLESGLTDESRVWNVLDRFHQYLDHLATGLSSREYSNLASKLDIGAVGGVVTEHLIEAKDSSELASRLLSGLVSEGLMVLATRQHVKAWEQELGSVHREATWYLYEELWRWAESLKPELEAAERRSLIDRLMEPAMSPEATGEYRAVLLGRLFQILLATYLEKRL